ncbi:MAG: AMP-binding protein [Alphaproteobacteria bacterium]|nr:AMP-binding protein [Alphaproteobacteria bacterium]
MLERLRQHPAEALAIMDQGAPCTYGALRDRAARLAARLPEDGVVAVLVEKSTDWVVAVIACAWRGVAFCPFSPGLPRQRVSDLVERLAPAALLAREDPELGVPCVALADRPGPALAPAPFAPERLAWVIFTSGSGGRPKAVEVPWRFVPTLIEAQLAAIGLEAGERSLFALDVGFDAAQSDLWCALTAGATLVIEPGCETAAGALRALRQREVHYVDLPPALLRRLDPADRPPSLRCVLIGGEVCPAETVRGWAAALRLIVVYGPTEACVCSSLVRATPAWDRPWIGAPLPGVVYRIVDEALREVPDGEVGELLIGGPGLAWGYRGDPDDTRRRFPEVDGRRWHRSGDLVLRESDGYAFVGRKDRQIKLGGRRVGLEEVEAALAAHPAVARAWVTSPPLRAHVEACAPVTAQALQAWAAARLPGWMCPQLRLLDRLPTTSSGKVDGGALARLAWAPTATVALATSAEQTLCALWSEVLGRLILPTDSLQAAGADSVAALELTAAAEHRGFALPPSVWLLEDSVAAALARLGPDPGVRSAALRPQGPLLAARPSPAGAPRRLLLTGATGGLGQALLPALLRRSEARMLCLVRAPDLEAARARLPLQDPRVDALPGDLAAPRLGLDAPTWGRLAHELDGVVHVGARVHLLAELEALWPTNVLGTARVLELFEAGAPKRLHLISSLSVFVASERNHGLALEADTLDDVGRVWGGYAQSKVAAEQLCRSTGLQAMAIHRPGLLVGAGQGDLLPRLLRGLARLGGAPAGGLDLELDLTPVQAAADAIARLVAQDARGTFHLAAPQPASLGQLVEALRAEGHPIEITEDSSFTRRAALARHPDASAAALALCRRLQPEAFAALRSLDLFQATGIRFDMRRAEAALGRPVCAAPDEALLRALVRGALPKEVSEMP